MWLPMNSLMRLFLGLCCAENDDGADCGKGGDRLDCLINYQSGTTGHTRYDLPITPAKATILMIINPNPQFREKPIKTGTELTKTKKT